MRNNIILFAFFIFVLIVVSWFYIIHRSNKCSYYYFLNCECSRTPKSEIKDALGNWTNSERNFGKLPNEIGWMILSKKKKIGWMILQVETNIWFCPYVYITYHVHLEARTTLLKRKAQPTQKVRECFFTKTCILHTIFMCNYNLIEFFQFFHGSGNRIRSGHLLAGFSGFLLPCVSQQQTQ